MPLTAKMAATFTLNGKSTGRVNGTLRIKRGEVIQMSITPFLGIEVGRAEISPEGVLVIDRVNKRYVQVSFEQLKGLANVNLDYHILEALFLNEIFLPGKNKLSVRDLSAAEVAQRKENWEQVMRMRSTPGWEKVYTSNTGHMISAIQLK